ncbi:DUF1178 family protein [Sulfitobacter sp. F26169L]|uniref:DUF1178 family protein n=1 Tax=Sulfitobacter sp. F26169L TaxID=2996015 RepID=UPI002260CC03|nr:DUF1178 family protein [Sulfitobacter sp. F26169L]
MIRYALKCREGHEFESWFQSASAFEILEKAGHLSCAVCGVSDVKKSLMAPRVGSDSEAVIDPKAQAIAEIRREVEQNSTYVGRKFAQKAREMHEGTAPETSIYGEANLAEARALIEDGVPVLPLPFKPKQKLQ